jgi:molecular chaperone HtpG
VRLSQSLGTHPVSLVPGDGMSFEMEKYFNRVDPENTMKSSRILELNAGHNVFHALETAIAEDPEKAKQYVELLYSQALLMADLPIEDPTAYTDLVCSLIR